MNYKTVYDQLVKQSNKLTTDINNLQEDIINGYLSNTSKKDKKLTNMQLSYMKQLNKVYKDRIFEVHKLTLLKDM